MNEKIQDYRLINRVTKVFFIKNTAEVSGELFTNSDGIEDIYLELKHNILSNTSYLEREVSLNKVSKGKYRYKFKVDFEKHLIIGADFEFFFKIQLSDNKILTKNFKLRPSKFRKMMGFDYKTDEKRIFFALDGKNQLHLKTQGEEEIILGPSSKDRIQNLERIDKKLRIQFNPSIKERFELKYLFLVDRNKKSIFKEIPLEKISAGFRAEIDFLEIEKEIEINDIIDLYLKSYDGKYRKLIQNKNKKSFFEENKEIEVKEKIFLPCRAKNQTFCIRVGNKYNLGNYYFKNYSMLKKRISFKKGILNYTGEIRSKLVNNISQVNVILKKSDSEIEHKVSATTKVKGNKFLEFKFSFDLKKTLLEPVYWSFFLEVEFEDGKKAWKRLNCEAENYKKILAEPYYQDDYLYFPFLTGKNGLSIMYRLRDPYEKKTLRIKEYIAFIIFVIFYPYFKYKKSWITFEKACNRAQDNGYYFYKYCRETLKKKNVYFIIRKDSYELKNLESKHLKKNVIYFYSFKHLIYLLSCEFLVSSESKINSYIARSQWSIFRKILLGKKIIFLQHGVIGTTGLPVFKNTLENKMDIFCVSSEFEKNIVRDNLGVPEENLKITGLTRWDHLEDKSKNKKNILIMPTWRNWLDNMDEDSFKSSEYFKKYHEMLNDNELIKMLKDNNVCVQFFLHPRFLDYTHLFQVNNYIEIVDSKEKKVNELLMESNMLITDYSSVAWEMYYQNKPVIFYQFDSQRMFDLRGRYMEDNEFFGDIVRDIEGLKNELAYYIENDFAEKEEFILFKDNYLKYRDKNNSKRVYEEIINYRETIKRKKLKDRIKESIILKEIIKESWWFLKRRKLLYLLSFKCRNFKLYQNLRNKISCLKKIKVK
ncbi:CDP-glycerol glycerophosphotransferase family protein [Psychrilyobacter sp.]|uniref:CDP-glycerol glycerophosphotransferase family protein n=1 Tax=Psychrilyobacter sp. TaxID=2586924 RepID=UPI00301A4562